MDAKYESVVVSSRVRLARNFRDYPFPNRLLRDPHSEEISGEIIRLVTGEFTSVEEFKSHRIREMPEELAALYLRHNLISRDLLRNRDISAVLISDDRSIAVMINEEDHIREQCIMDGYDLDRVYERISGIDGMISESIPFAYDERLGYLTACPTNLGTGLRASAMLFLPALMKSREGKNFAAELKKSGFALRGTFGEGSGAECDLWQLSNEITLGSSEEDIISDVKSIVDRVVELEITLRKEIMQSGGAALKDKIMRSYGILANAYLLGAKEFAERIGDIRLGIALGYIDGDVRLLVRLVNGMSAALRSDKTDAADDLMREDPDRCRAEYVRKALSGRGIKA